MTCPYGRTYEGLLEESEFSKNCNIPYSSNDLCLVPVGDGKGGVKVGEAMGKMDLSESV